MAKAITPKPQTHRPKSIAAFRSVMTPVTFDRERAAGAMIK